MRAESAGYTPMLGVHATANGTLNSGDTTFDAGDRAMVSIADG